MLKRSLLSLVVFTFLGCSDLSYQSRQNYADQLTLSRGWSKQVLPTEQFDIASYGPEATRRDTLVIYIEGDGLAWLSRRQPSQNPTPLSATGLKLALQHPGNKAVYLARPCQYVNDGDYRNCRQRYWTSDRFSIDVVNATNEAIHALKQQHQSKQLVLIGYSGGGAIAALVAAKRDDVTRLISIAGNLDTESWVTHHGVSPLSGSLNPADQWRSLQDISQVHFVGDKDEVIPPLVANAYKSRFPPNKPILIEHRKDFDHQCCWVQQWPSLVETLGLPEQ